MIIPTPNKFRELYTTDKSIILLTGGRGSGKSFNTSLFVKRLTYEANHVILFSRYTMISANDSIVPEFVDKMEREKDEQMFDVNRKDILNLFSGSRIMFRGIKTSSGNQTAKLKSIQGLTTFVVDEAEEWEDEDDFDKIRLSIRTQGMRTRVIIVMNPSDDSHFIYEKYIKDSHRIEMIDGVPVQISTHPDVLHIHTTYLDNIENLNADFLNQIEYIKQKHLSMSPDEQVHSKYSTKIIGRWTDTPEGAVFKNVRYADESEFDRSLPYGFGLDFGFFPDPDVCNKVAVDNNRKIIYVREMFHRNMMNYHELEQKLARIATKNDMIACDTNDGRARNELAQKGFHVVKAMKGAGSVAERYKKMAEYEIVICGESPNAKEGFRKHKWSDKKAGVPENKFKHHPDSVGYIFDYLSADVKLW